jgi:hypothetical protein
MTVKELINRLRNFNQNSEVVMKYDSGYDYLEIDQVVNPKDDEDYREDKPSIIPPVILIER